jgi:hypothetical protein
MALTRSFRELVQRQVANDPAYGEALLREGIDTMLAGDIDSVIDDARFFTTWPPGRWA